MTAVRAEQLRVEGLHKYFGALEVLRGIDMELHRGEVVVILAGLLSWADSQAGDNLAGLRITHRDNL